MLSRFQSTPPVKAATHHSSRSRLGRQSISIHAAREGGDNRGRYYPPLRIISIHAAREGGDGGWAYQWAVVLHFNPRRP